MSKKHYTSIKKLEMQIGKLSWQIVVLLGSSGGFTSNIMDNPKNEISKALKVGFEVVTNIVKDEVVGEVLRTKYGMRKRIVKIRVTKMRRGSPLRN